jgi:hypothetical protein
MALGALANALRDRCRMTRPTANSKTDRAPHYRQLYFEKYIKLDPFTTTQFVVDIEEPKSFLEVMPYADLIQTRLYKEWAQPQGIVDALCA